ncbi:MAG: vWA domain-containing protein [Halocynthiibacter sp.]
MTHDPLNTLKSAMDAATPRPDENTKAAHIRLAMENAQKTLGDSQGMASSERLTSESSKELGLLMKGFFAMKQLFRPKTIAAMTTSIVAIGVGFYMVTSPNTSPLSTGPSPEISSNAASETSADVQGEILPDTYDILPSPHVSMEPVPNGITLQKRSKMAEHSLASPSLTRPIPEPPIMQEREDKTFATATENAVKTVQDNPVSTFSTDVDTASYSQLRMSVNRGQLPPQDAVRVEEMVNYFPYDYAAPTDNHPLAAHISVTKTPWNPETQLLQIGLQAKRPATENLPPLNLVFLVDTSGSMQDPQKLPLLKQSLDIMLAKLRPEDEIAIVAYAGSAGLVLSPTSASEPQKIKAALDQLAAGGSTAGEAGLKLAYQTAETMAKDGEISRVMIATDGDFNVGLESEEALKSFISTKRESGTYLSVLGFGLGHFDDAIMQTLAQNGNGIAAHIDSLQEAQKTLVDQVSGALFPVANDVKIQVEFNPNVVAEYRLIGYETRALNREDFNNDKKDAGEIGAGHQVTALYEITPVGSPAVLNDALRYQKPAQTGGDTAEIGHFKMRYKRPGATQSTLIDTPIINEITPASADVQFATAIAGFGQILKGATYIQNWDLSAAIELANGAKGDDPYGYRTEAIRLMRLAQSLQK